MRSLALLSLVAACADPPGASPGGDVPVDVGDTDRGGPDLEVAGPGRVALRRLTRGEYDRTVRDVVGLDLGLAAAFPVDDWTAGFDVVASGLAISPLLVELYDAAAARIAAAMLEVPLAAPVSERVELEDGGFTVMEGLGEATGQGFRLDAVGSVDGFVTVPADGLWRIDLLAWGIQAGPDLPRVRVAVGAAEPTVFEVAASDFRSPGHHVVDVALSRGRHPVSVAFLNDWYGDGQARAVELDALVVQGPLDLVPTSNPARDRWITCDPEAPGAGSTVRACIASILEALAPVAWRRPLEPGEVDDLLEVSDRVLVAGDPALWALEFALRALFTSPHFVLHVEPAPPAEGGPAPLPDHALASRLSYLLWSSAPDAPLRALADAGTLNDPDVLAAQVTRMLADPRAVALAEDFGGQWLLVRAVDGASPDPATYPAFDEALRGSMKASMTRWFAELTTSDTPLTALLDGDWAYVDRTLAPVLDLPVDGLTDALVAVDVADLGRRGWLTQPGLLMVTSHPTRTSPVKRGVWVLTDLLCDAPEPPPPGVPAFPEAGDAPSSVRDRLEAHRALPQCAACHDAFDPIGLAFEGFDGLGRARTEDGGLPVDTRGELPDGTLLDGVPDLADALLKDPRFARCVVEKAFTYAHGRAPVAADEGYVDDALARAQASGFSLRAVLTALVTSDTFRLHGEPR